MAVRYRHSFEGYDGTNWQINIYDTDHVGAPRPFDCESGGFELSRNAQNKNRVSPILGSEVTVKALSKNAQFDLMLNDMVSTDENRFFCLIYKNSSLWWAGVLLLDLFDEADKYYPRPVALRFTDGIARLKNIDYNHNGTRYIGKETIIEHLWNIFLKIPTAQFWSGSNIMLKTGVSYWDTQMSYSANADPLPSIRVDHDAFKTVKQNGDIEYFNCYEVLQNFASNFYSRVWLGGGAFNFVQVDKFRLSSFKVFEYEKSGTASVNTANISPRVTVTQDSTLARLAGGNFKMYAGLKEVVVKYDHKTSGTFLPSPLMLGAGPENLGNVDDNGGDAHFNVDGALTVTVVNTSGVAVRVRVRLNFKQGSYYLRRDATTAGDNANFNSLSWETGLYDVQFQTHETIAGETRTFRYAAKFETPYLPNDGDLVLDLASVNGYDVEDLAGNPVTSGVTITGDFTAFVEYKTDSKAETERTFKASNSALGNLSKVLKLPKAFFGDQINSSTKSALEVKNMLSSWVRSALWKKDNTGTPQKLLGLLCSDILAGQQTATKKYVGTIRGDVDFFNTLQKNSEFFAFLSGTFDPQKMQWNNSEMFKIAHFADLITSIEVSEAAGNYIPSVSNAFGVGTVYDDSTSINGQNINIQDANGNVSVGPAIGGSDNVNLGGGLSSSTSGTGVVAIGGNTGVNNTGNYNFFAVEQSGFSNTSGAYNFFVGFRAGRSNVGGNDNIFIGRDAGFSNTSGGGNIFAGKDAGRNNLTGSYNIFLGFESGNNNTLGQFNFFSGYRSGLNNTGDYNTFIGANAGYSNTSGGYNTFIGANAGYSNTTQFYSIFIGRESGYNAVGSNNIFLGYRSGYNQTTAGNVIALGESADNPSNYSHALVIGKGAVANAANSVNIGTAADNLGTVTAVAVTSNATWQVYINGVLSEILIRQ